MPHLRVEKPSNIAGRKTKASVIQWLLFLVTALAIVILAALIWDITSSGARWLSLDLLTNTPSRKPEEAGLRPALLGTLWVIGLTALFAFPVGVGAAVYLEEYAPNNRWTPLAQDQYRQPRRHSLDRLRLAGPGRVRQPPGAGADGHLRRADDGPADLAGHHHRQPGGDSGRAAIAQTGRVRARRDPLAGRPGPCHSRRRCRAS